MMYGVGLPILFPIASASLLLLYLIEKLFLYYSYREPPKYDSSLNKNALSILTWAPVFSYLSATGCYQTNNYSAMITCKFSTIAMNLDSHNTSGPLLSAQALMTSPSQPYLFS